MSRTRREITTLCHEIMSSSKTFCGIEDALSEFAYAIINAGG